MNEVFWGSFLILSITATINRDEKEKREESRERENSKRQKSNLYF